MRVGAGVQEALGSVLTMERLTQPQPLCSTTLCLQDSMQPSAGSPHPPCCLHHLHHTPDPPPGTPSGCCYNHWQHNRLIRRFTVLITHAQKCCWRFLFGGSSLHTISPRLKANVACKTVWLSLTPLRDADSQWHPTDSWNGWGPPDFWGL